MAELRSGKYERVLWVIKNLFKEKRTVVEETADGKMEERIKEFWLLFAYQKVRLPTLFPSLEQPRICEGKDQE